MLHNSIPHFPSHYRIYVFILFNLPVFIYVIIICRQTDKQINKQAKSIKSYDVRRALTMSLFLFGIHTIAPLTHALTCSFQLNPLLYCYWVQRRTVRLRFFSLLLLKINFVVSNALSLSPSHFSISHPILF